jgi:NadR type nicotinamide-nucleotide adenylyltransferase
MGERFRAGLIVGKFSPLHRGHELLAARAFDLCAEVVIISYSKPELSGCDADARERWLGELFPAARRLVVDDQRLREISGPDSEWREVPDDEADAEVHRRFCAFLCSSVLRIQPDAIFTSEAYGDGFAAALTLAFRATDPESPEVQHVQVDLARAIIPVSATKIRSDVHGNREWLSPAVYASFVERICVLGGESSGKSSLSEALARNLRTVWVAEYGRELWEFRDGAFRFEDMLEIANEQIALEEAAARVAKRFVICDTSPLTTLFYSQHIFGHADPALERLAGRPYDRIVLCAPDFPFVQDGTRATDSLRLAQHVWYLRELDQRGKAFLLVSGDIDERVDAIVSAIDNGWPS